jgi:hypothetical protein
MKKRGPKAALLLCIVRLVLGQLLKLRERIESPAFISNANIGQSGFKQRPDPIEGGHSGVELLNEFLNCRSGDDLEAHAQRA